MAYDELVGMLSQMDNCIVQATSLITKLDNSNIPDDSKELEKLHSDIMGQIKSTKENFSIAVVGEFKTGKSTFINGILGLIGEQALSTEDSPDTACPTIIKYKDSSVEAKIIYDTGYEEITTWAEARKLTSQIAREKDPAINLKAEKILEIEYYLQHELLTGVNIVDLPGTGSRYVEEHTDITHQKMREADLVLWMVSSEQEPSFSASVDLRILSEIASSVIPVINVQEDPTVAPPLLRDEESIRTISNAVITEFRQFFAEDISKPFEVSSRVVEVEMQKDNPDKETLQQAGLTDFLDFLLDRYLKRQDTLKTGKFKRLCGNIAEIAVRVRTIFSTIKDNCSTLNKSLGRDDQELNILLEKIEDARFAHRIQIRPLARNLAHKINNYVAEMARLFIEDTLTMANIKDLMATLKQNGKDKLKKDLTEKLENDYLGMSKSPNWIDGMRADFSQDVYEVLYPSWQRIQRTIIGSPEYDGAKEEPQIELRDLPEKLQKAVFDVIEKVIVIGGVAALLAKLPGGQIVDAIGIVGLIILSFIKDPLEKPRKNAIQRTWNQLQVQIHIMTSDLLNAGMVANKVFEDHVTQGVTKKRAGLQEKIDLASKGLSLADNTTELVDDITSRLTKMF